MNSLATDLGMGQPSGHAVQTCSLSVLLAQDLGIPDEQIISDTITEAKRIIGSVMP